MSNATIEPRSDSFFSEKASAKTSLGIAEEVINRMTRLIELMQKMQGFKSSDPLAKKIEATLRTLEEIQLMVVQPINQSAEEKQSSQTFRS